MTTSASQQPGTVRLDLENYNCCCAKSQSRPGSAGRGNQSGSRIFFLPRVFHVAPFRGKEYNKFRFQSERAEVTVRVQASMKILDSYTLVHFDGWRNPITLVGKHLERHGSL